MQITSLANKHIQSLCALHDIKEIKERKMFLVEGRHLVDEAYNAGLLLEVIALKEEKYVGIETTIVNEAILKKLSFTSTPQMLVGVVRFKDLTLDDGNIIMLDGISDPGNMGTIIRTAKAFGINNIICSLDTVNMYNDKVIRATQGAIFKTNVKYCNLCEEIDSLNQKGYTVLATSLSSNKDISEIKKPSKFALVIGNEANGVSKEVLNKADISFIIKMKGDMESLNASVASAICIWELTK